MNPTTAGIAGVLLAGGKSRRMGRDKRFLELGGRTLLARALSTYEELFSDVLVVVAESLDELAGVHHRVVTDLVPNCGSLGGLYTGLSHATYDQVFAAACDMPFLDPAVIALMAGLDRDADIVIPRLTTGLEPMHAIYSKTCLPHLQRMIKDQNLRLHELAQTPGLAVRIVSEEEIQSVDPQLLSFLNVNRPADLEFARKLDAGPHLSSGGA